MILLPGRFDSMGHYIHLLLKSYKDALADEFSIERFAHLVQEKLRM